MYTVKTINTQSKSVKNIMKIFGWKIFWPNPGSASLPLPNHNPFAPNQLRTNSTARHTASHPPISYYLTPVGS